MANTWQQPRPPFEPIKFVPASEKTQILATPIQSIKVVAHTAFPVQSGAPTNHWCFYAKKFTSGSIRIDCQPSYSEPSTVLASGSKANIVISSLPYDVSNNAKCQKVLSVPPNITIQNVVDALVAAGRHKYEFDVAGIGCRCWVTDQIGLFVQKGLAINNSDVQAAKNAVLMLWPENVPSALDAGAYYP